jgi:hypothetical protein
MAMKLSALSAGLLLPRKFLILISATRLVDPGVQAQGFRVLLRLEELSRLKSPVTLSDIEIATIQLVACNLVQLFYFVPHLMPVYV